MCPQAAEPTPALDTSANRREFPFSWHVLVLLLIVVAAVGSVRSLLNASSLHAFYSSRLTRAYLGASNLERLNNAAYVTDVIHGDDLASDHYWNWPRPKSEAGLLQKTRDAILSGARSVRSWFGGESKRLESARVPPAQSLAEKGAPLHFVNVTVNETLNGRTGVQVQDRKGVPLAVGPGGFSVGVRHHLIADAEQGFIPLPKGDGHAVFTETRLASEPEVMTLGRWVSLSGAAFSSALGSRTSVPMALLATFANVRLGYWWDSGLGRRWLAPLFPVYRGLLAECLARLRGTGIRLWNLTDGGHFENLGGYELIRRKLSLIVLIDAEADPDFEFPGLSELIRKARLDFGAEIHFLDDDELRAKFPALAPKAQGAEAGDDVPPLFTTLERLRRGRWNSAKGKGATLAAKGNRRAYSHAHAAFATVKYHDESVGHIVYVKASLTGREPADVLQYHAEHLDFPHETTADQFFDEAQWESYRRLGEHIGTTVLGGGIDRFVSHE